MQTGTKISAIAHVGLIAVAVFGGAFRSEPLPFEVREVTVISPEEFAALTAPQAPEAIGNSPRPPTRPAPEVEQAEPPAPAPTPEPPAPAETDPVPIPDAPAPDPAPEIVQEESAPAPSDRVAPDAVPEPPEEVTPDEVEQQEVATDEGAETPQEEQEATAPEAASERIVTEAEAGDDQLARLAPQRSPRPPATRPDRPAPTEPTPTAQPAPDTSDAVDAALAEALGGADTPDVPRGPPLSAGERDALRVAVSRCWNVGSLSSDALGTTVVVAVTMAQDGTPITDSIRMVSSSGGTGGSARDAFGAARRAIIRCGSSGFDLPAEKYDQWRDIEMTFNPERMRIR